MGRVFSPQGVRQSIQPQEIGGRIFGGTAKSTPILDDYAGAAWEDIPFGQKVGRIAEEIPKVLYHFLPPATREFFEKPPSPERGVIEAEKEFLTAGVKGAGQFLQSIARVSADAIGGGVLSGVEKVIGKPVSVNIPLLGEVSSWGVQKKQLEDQGFSSDEAAALVGINAYLGILPVAVRGLKTETGRRVVERITTKEVPIAETPAGIRQDVIAETKPPTTTAGAEIAPTTVIPEAVGRVERRFITGIKRIFGKTKEQQDFNTLLENHLDKYFEGRQALLGREDPLNQALLKLSDEELQSYSYTTQGITTLEKPSANLKNAIDLWRKTNQEIEADLIQRGKLAPEQVQNRRWKPVETITGRSREELKGLGVEPIYYPYLAEELLKKSDFIPATGRRTKGGYLKRFTGKMLAEDSYIKNPKIAIPRHRVQVFRDKMNAEFVETIRDTFAETDKNIIRKYKDDPRFVEMMGVEEWKPAGSLRFYPLKPKGVGVSKKVESYWIPKEVAKELNRFYKPGIPEKAFRMTYDPLIDMWRVSVLSLVPRWFYNNFNGNTILSILGKTDPFAFGKVTKEMFAQTQLGQRFGISQREIPKGVFAKRYAGGEPPAVGQLGGLPREQTQFLRPIENWLNLLEQAKNYRALRIPAAATQNLIKGWVALGKPLEHLNKVTENWFRGAMYISKTEGKFLGFQLDKPVPPAEGLKHVNEFLFDYSKLTRLERATFRRVLPFYNWMKNITEFSFKFPVNHPLRGLIVGALLQDYVDYINEVNQKTDRVKSVLRIKTDMTYEGKPLYLNVKSAIPFSDVFRTIPTDFETFGRFLTSNPVSKIIIERAFKMNSFTGQPFTQPKELQEFDEFGKPILPLPSLPKHIGKQFPQIQFGRNIIEAARFGKPIKRFETGEPKIFRGRIQTEDWLMPVLRYFGINISPIEFNKIKEQTERKQRRQEVKKRRFERQIESEMKRLKSP